MSVQDEVADTGLMMMGHRFYAPDLGRFLNRDPIGFAGGMNLFEYASSSPTMRSDPTGLRDVVLALSQTDVDYLNSSLGTNLTRESFRAALESRINAFAGLDINVGLTSQHFKPGDFSGAPGFPNVAVNARGDVMLDLSFTINITAPDGNGGTQSAPGASTPSFSQVSLGECQQYKREGLKGKPLSKAQLENLVLNITMHELIVHALTGKTAHGPYGTLGGASVDLELFSSGLLPLEKGPATFTVENRGTFLGIIKISFGSTTVENGMWNLYDKTIQLLGD